MYFGYITCYFIGKVDYWFGGWAGSIGDYKTPCFDHFQQSEYTFLDYLVCANFGIKIN